MDLQWYVGVDWGKSEHQICLLDAAGKQQAERKIAHSGAGFVELAQWLSAQTNQSDSASIGVALETSSGPVVDCLLALGYRVAAINPKQADRFRDRFSPAGAKDDRHDAFVLATALYLEPQALRTLEILDAETLELRERHRMREQLVRTKKGIAQKIRQGLWRYYPSFESWFGADLGLPVVQALWQHMPNPEVTQRRRKSSVATILKAHKIRRFQAEQVLAQLRAEPLPVSTTTTMLLQEQITLWFQQLDLVQQQLNTVTQQLESKLESMSTMASASTTGTSGTNPPHPSDRDILASIPGVGTIVLANLLGEAGTAIRNRDHAALRCLTGVAPVTKRSGKSYRVQRRRAANLWLVDSVYHWARVAAQVDPTCRQRYEALRTRGHTHGRALRSVADRLLAVACAMLKTGTLYQRSVTET